MPLKLRIVIWKLTHKNQPGEKLACPPATSPKKPSATQAREKLKGLQLNFVNFSCNLHVHADLTLICYWLMAIWPLVPHANFHKNCLIVFELFL